MKPRGRTVRVALAAAAAIGLLVAATAIARRAGRPAAPGAGLAYEARKDAHVLTVEAPGLVTAEVEEDVVVPEGLSNLVIESILEEGAAVRKGDLVVSLSTFQARKEVLEAKIAVADKKAELARQEREDALKLAEAEDVLRQKSEQLAAARALLAYLEKGADPLEVERLELKIRSARVELGDLERKEGIQKALRQKGFASGVQAREAADAVARKRLEIEKDVNLLAKEREGATAEERRKHALAAGKLEKDVDLARRDLEERKAILGLEREKKKLEIRAKEEVVAQKERALAGSRLLAPIDGSVLLKGDFFRGEGYRVGTEVWGGTAVATVVRMDHPRAVVLVGENAIDRIKEAMRATVRIPAAPGVLFGGKILSISRTSRPRDPTDSSGAKDFEITVALEGDARHLKPNLPVRAVIEVARLSGVFRVPKETVTEDPARRALTVRRLGAPGPAASPVEAADEDQDWYYLKSGLSDGDRLSFE